MDPFSSLQAARVRKINHEDKVLNQTGMQDAFGKLELGKTLPLSAMLIDKLAQPYLCLRCCFILFLKSKVVGLK